MEQQRCPATSDPAFAALSAGWTLFHGTKMTQFDTELRILDYFKIQQNSAVGVSYELWHFPANASLMLTFLAQF